WGLPEPGKQAVAHRRCVLCPSFVSSKHLLLGVDSVEQRYPSGYHHEHRAEIPFLEVVPDVPNDVGEVHRMSNKSLRTWCHQTAQSRTDSEQSAKSKETGETQYRSERHQDEPEFRPCRIAREPS